LGRSYAVDGNITSFARTIFPVRSGMRTYTGIRCLRHRPEAEDPITFPVRTEDTLARNSDQYPGHDGVVHYSEALDVGYRDYLARGVRPLFAFGFGLSYTQFNYSDLLVRQISSAANPALSVAFTVTNISNRSGTDVPQIYVSFPHIDEGDEPPFQLKRFQRVTLNPGQSKMVHLELKAGAFS
jgi:beta-glucosidase